MIYGLVTLALAQNGAVIRNEARWSEMRAGVHMPANHTAKVGAAAPRRTVVYSVVVPLCCSLLYSRLCVCALCCRSQYTAVEAMPKTFSWGNVDGESYLTSIRNQHIPVYCGSCWAMGSSSALADRWNIVSKKAAKANGDDTAALPQTMLSVQNIVSCGNDKTGCGSCNGGDDSGVYEYAKKFGIPHESCSNYMAVNTRCRADKPVTDENKPPCYTCSPGRAGCKAISAFDKLYISGYGEASGYAKMKQEIYANGACGQLRTAIASQHPHPN